MAVTVEGNRDILGLWAGNGGEGAKYWLQVLTELKNRGAEDVLVVVCDGLSGPPDSVNTVWPDMTVQTCIVHLMRTGLTYSARQHWGPTGRGRARWTRRGKQAPNAFDIRFDGRLSSPRAA